VLGFQKVSIPQIPVKKGKKKPKQKKTKVTLRFVVPTKDELKGKTSEEESGTVVHWKLLLISDCWIGADQSIPLEYRVKNGTAKEDEEGGVDE
jgi:hypothetical protein